MELDLNSKDIDILKKIKDLDDRLLKFHRAELFFEQNNLAIKEKIKSIDSDIQLINDKLKDFNDQIDGIKNDILACKKKETELLVLKEKTNDADTINRINEDIDIQRLKTQLFNNNIDDINAKIKQQQTALTKLENDKLFFIKNNDKSFEKENINVKISDINASKRQLLNTLNADTLKDYNDLFSLEKQKLAISTIVDGFCECCHLQTTLQQQESVLQQKKLVHCEYCGCFLVNTENYINE